ncbi:hypothetical protein [Flavobacterium sp. LHD-85]|uniref:hypothetical protein n=1 Tax=Flavobacterium sp. LHD-85 TaxID=3071410 RepID=UPI0027E202C4|nr:hypothetical protein [Flavobacterium sp. LHD-85]MDQ6528932.1 hypothetical protein [Flavobacterium sp. LHD-85]
MDFMLSPKERAQKYWAGFLYKTQIECERAFDWLHFEVKGQILLATGSLERNGRTYHFKIEWSPFFPGRFDRVWVETKKLKKSFDTHFNGDGSLCLYHPIKDLKGRPYVELVDIIPWISEWMCYYDKYLDYKVWLGPEHPHNFN